MLLMTVISGTQAQRADYSKMSSWLRQLTLEQQSRMRRAPAARQQEVCAFVRISTDVDGVTTPEEVLQNMGCRTLAQVGNIAIASIPLRALPALSKHPRVERIEARQGNSIHMDTTTVVLGAARAHLGDKLPQAFTGKGVLMGVEDIGFDITHPNFYNSSATQYRVKRMWDFLSLDTVGSTCFVGADYTTEEALKAYAHSRDGIIQSHGTHTLGAAAGSGYDSPYRGMAPGCDICVVSNAVSEDLEFIDSTDVYKFTYATDALGFKYIFDYADEMGMPCVISFSEGSAMDFRGDDVLYYEMLDSLTGPGHILVASAGNAGQQVTHVRKPETMERAQVAILSGGAAAYFSAKGRSDNYRLTFRLDGTDNQSVQYPLDVQMIYAAADSLISDTLMVGEKPYYITATCYPSCFNDEENVMEVVVQTDKRLGLDYYCGVEVLGDGVEVELFRGAGYLLPEVAELGDNAYSVHSPASAPSVICVGATGYRTGVVNYLGDYREYNMGTSGKRSNYSSVGPTYDGRIKPDVMAPGTNIISSYSSYYIEAQPDASDLLSDVQRFEFRGRTYSWNANSGTSMSTPVVAGAIALWLEAKPQLSPKDVMEVIKATSRQYDNTLSYPNNLYGYGEVDAYAGLLYVLGLSGISEISHFMPKDVRMAVDDAGMLTLGCSRETNEPIVLKIFNTSGMLVRIAEVTPVDGRASMSMADMPRGVYVVQVNGVDDALCGSSLVRR